MDDITTSLENVLNKTGKNSSNQLIKVLAEFGIGVSGNDLENKGFESESQELLVNQITAEQIGNPSGLMILCAEVVIRSFQGGNGNKEEKQRLTYLIETVYKTFYDQNRLRVCQIHLCHYALSRISE